VSETILVVNAGSSSIKFQLFSVAARDQLQRLLKGQIEGIGVHPRLVAKGTEGEPPIEEAWQAQEVSSVPQALDKLVERRKTQLGEHRLLLGRARPDVPCGEGGQRARGQGGPCGHFDASADAAYRAASSNAFSSSGFDGFSL